MKLEVSGIEVEVDFDGDGFPLISIQTNGYIAEYGRPAVQVELNSVTIHHMFDDEDERWLDEPTDSSYNGPSKLVTD